VSGSKGGFSGPCKAAGRGLYHQLAELLPAQAGISILQLDYRVKGSRHRDSNVDDCVEAIDWLRRNRKGSPVAILGHMIGGANALAAACKRGKYVDGVMTMGAPTTGVPQESELRKLGAAEVLITHGSEDMKTAPKNANNIYQRMCKTKRLGVEKMKTYTMATHDFLGFEDEIVQDILNWLDRAFVDEL